MKVVNDIETFYALLETYDDEVEAYSPGAPNADFCAEQMAHARDALIDHVEKMVKQRDEARAESDELSREVKDKRARIVAILRRPYPGHDVWAFVEETLVLIGEAKP